MSDYPLGREGEGEGWKFPWRIILTPSFILCVYIAIVAHFLLVAKIAHSMWDPSQFPEWLKTIDVFFVYHIHSFVQFIQIVLWLLVIAVAGVLVFGAVCVPAVLIEEKLYGKDDKESSLGEAFLFMFLPISISLISLVIIPVESMRKPSETILEEGQSMQFVEFIDYLSKGTFLIFIVILIFVILFGIISIIVTFSKGDPDKGSVWQLLVAIVISIAGAIGAGIGLFRLIEPLQSRTSGYSSLLFMFGVYSLISVLTVSVSRLLKWIASLRKKESAKTSNSDTSEYKK